MGEQKEGKVKLTEPGAEALAAWMKRGPGRKPADLADAMGTHGMLPGRALKRQGWLTLEQAGQLVAFAGGELTAEQLFGSDRAGAVPVYPPRQRKAPARPAPAPAAAPTPGVDPDLAELDETSAGSDLPATKRVLVALRDNPEIADGTRVAAAKALAIIVLQEEKIRTMRGDRATVDRTTLREKMQALLFQARRQWGEATGNSYMTSAGQVLTAVPGAEPAALQAQETDAHG